MDAKTNSAEDFKELNSKEFTFDTISEHIGAMNCLKEVYKVIACQEKEFIPVKEIFVILEQIYNLHSYGVDSLLSYQEYLELQQAKKNMTDEEYREDFYKTILRKLNHDYH